MLRPVTSLMAAVALAGCDDATAPAVDVPPPKPAAGADAALAFYDSGGNLCRPLAADGRVATVLIFLMRDCPVANAMAPELARLAAGFAAKGVRFYGVYATESAQEIAAHRKDYSLPFPGLLDPKLQLARLAGATRTPEAAVLSPNGELRYRGRIDDRAVEQGVMKPVPHRHDLRLALEAILAGKYPEPKFTEAVGCYLPVEN